MSRCSSAAALCPQFVFRLCCAVLLLLVSLYVLTVRTLHCEALAVGVVAASLTLPVISVGASIMTIDSPYTCCWGWALVCAHRAVFDHSRWAWLLTGVLIGVGILAKYTMVLFVPSLGLFLLTTPAYRGLLMRRGFWAACAISAFCCLPILIWNAQNGWVTVRHVAALAGVSPRGPTEPTHFHLTGPFVLFGAQAALLLVFWFVAWLCAIVVHRPTIEKDLDLRFLWWLSAPMFGLFLAMSVKTGGGEVNWPVTAYLSGMVLTAPWLVRQLQSPRPWYRGWVYANVTLACTLGLAITVFMHRTDLLYPLLSEFTGAPTPADPFPLRKVDPSCRLKGWSELGQEVDRICQQVFEAEGVEPVLAGCGWAMPGELGFYCAGHPQAYSLGLALGDRHSQYDLWKNPLDNPESFRGRTFLIVGAVTDARLGAGFDRTEEVGRVMFQTDGHPLAAWSLLLCHGYKGLPLPDGDMAH